MRHHNDDKDISAASAIKAHPLLDSPPSPKKRDWLFLGLEFIATSPSIAAFVLSG